MYPHPLFWTVLSTNIQISNCLNPKENNSLVCSSSFCTLSGSSSTVCATAIWPSTKRKREDPIWCNRSSWCHKGVIYCSAVKCDAAERCQWMISEQRHMSGSESVDQSVLVNSSFMGLRAAGTWLSTLHRSTVTEEGAACPLRCPVIQHTACRFPHAVLTSRLVICILVTEWKIHQYMF